MTAGDVTLVPVGRHAALVEVPDAAAALSLSLHLRATCPWLTEVVPAATTVLVDGLDLSARERLRSALDAWAPGRDEPRGELVELPTTYDGDDLDTVAGLWGTDRDGVVARHQEVEFVSAFCGFAPGFAYLTGLPDDLAVPRLDSPRTRVPAGAVGLAGEWCGVYPSASPGGWQLLGHADVRLWDAAATEPALLAPGTRVRFVAR